MLLETVKGFPDLADATQYKLYVSARWACVHGKRQASGEQQEQGKNTYVERS